jgi:hypothetical protein
MALRDDDDDDDNDGSNDDEQTLVIMGRAGWFCFVLCLRCSLIIYQIDVYDAFALPKSIQEIVDQYDL